MPDIVAPIVPRADPTANELYLRGLSLVAAMNAKKNSNERMIQQLDEKIRNDNLTHEAAMNRAENSAQHAQDMYQIGEKNAETKEATFQLNKDKATAALDDLSDLEKDARTKLKDLNPGTKEYESQLHNIILDHGRAADTTQGARRIKELADEHNRQYNIQDKAFKDLTKNQGIPWDAFANPGNWQVSPDHKDKVFVKVPLWDNNGLPVADPVNRGQQMVQYRTLPKSDYQSLQKKYDQLYREPSSGNVVPKDQNHSSEWQKAKAAMGSRDPMQVKKMYQSKGYDPSELDSDTSP